MAGLQRLWQAVALLAAALIGFGLILWLAANWNDFGRMGRFAVLQGALAIAALAAAARPALRAPGALAVLLATGALFAYYGQTYQTGADPWQLFALWALLTLPLALAARSDVLWLPWCLVAMTAVSLWAQAHTGHAWRVRPQDLRVHASAAAMATLVLLGLAPWARRYTGAGPWSFRLAAALFALLLALTALGGLFREPAAPQYAGGVLLLALATAGFARQRGFDLFALSLATLALDALLVAGAARWLLDGDFDAIGHLLLLGLAAAALLALSVRAVQRRAQACGAWTAGTAATAPGERPWPVVLLTALGAWLAALPLLGAVALLLGDWVHAGSGPYAVGALLLALAATLLRRPHATVFVEQLALPLLLAGLGTLGYGLARDLPLQLAAGLLAVLLLALAWWAGRAQAGLQGLLGAAAAAATAFVLHGESDWHPDGLRPWLALHGTLLLGLAAMPRAPLAATATGWIALTLAAFAAASGMTFLVGGVLGPLGQFGDGGGLIASTPWMASASVLLALAAFALAARHWPALRRPGCAGLALVAAALCAFLPLLGGILLAALLAASGNHRRLALCSALAAAWTVGSFYYALAWPLAHKAVLMVACGAALAALAWRAQRGHSTAAAFAPRAAAALVLGGLATLLVANLGIWRKEQLIARGAPVFVALAPVDPRSLLQGDYMRLAFAIPHADDADPWDGQAMVVAQRDARGVATLLRLAAPGEALVPPEFALRLTPKDGRWTLVTDAWFFREGEAERFAQARYGEFRVAPDGSALLVGLADAELQALR
ncbi:GDYXXLXY domain-containing protein [Pseudorhodoferax sp. Leaf265]|uniref:GDYXXLXY domain-containing protein n=1 Tax=Pseudorhodoferax sp. Leaf265 TaxID=1736315 RepID=UPI0006FDF2F0|nr:GDYXXLXY domain-containing protein [Pseudorhodoferax sp. Leaf265]KQP21214.1 hypothetical protein ASF45_03235 [Pseudorhodoferax sp. Leaf265]